MKQSVLIVDCDPDVLAQLSMYLRDSEFRVHAASDLESAMGLLKNYRLPIAIVDWELPNGEAPELLHLIRSNDRLRRTHILVLSTKTDSSNIAESMNAGADDFFSKPIDASELRSRLTWATCRNAKVVV